MHLILMSSCTLLQVFCNSNIVSGRMQELNKIDHHLNRNDVIIFNLSHLAVLSPQIDKKLTE